MLLVRAIAVLQSDVNMAERECVDERMVTGVWPTDDAASWQTVDEFAHDQGARLQQAVIQVRGIGAPIGIPTQHPESFTQTREHAAREWCE